MSTEPADARRPDRRAAARSGRRRRSWTLRRNLTTPRASSMRARPPERLRVAARVQQRRDGAGAAVSPDDPPRAPAEILDPAPRPHASAATALLAERLAAGTISRTAVVATVRSLLEAKAHVPSRALAQALISRPHRSTPAGLGMALVAQWQSLTDSDRTSCAPFPPSCAGATSPSSTSTSPRPGAGDRPRALSGAARRRWRRHRGRRAGGHRQRAVRTGPRGHGGRGVGLLEPRSAGAPRRSADDEAKAHRWLVDAMARRTGPRGAAGAARGRAGLRRHRLQAAGHAADVVEPRRLRADAGEPGAPRRATGTLRLHGDDEPWRARPRVAARGCGPELSLDTAAPGRDAGRRPPRLPRATTLSRAHVGDRLRLVHAERSSARLRLPAAPEPAADLRLVPPEPAGRCSRPRRSSTCKAHGPVGCRDWTTVDLLLGAGVPAFFSGCLTTTVDAVVPRTWSRRTGRGADAPPGARGHRRADGRADVRRRSAEDVRDDGLVAEPAPRDRPAGDATAATTRES